MPATPTCKLHAAPVTYRHLPPRQSLTSRRRFCPLPGCMYVAPVLPHATSRRQLARVGGHGGTSQAPRQHTYKQVGVSVMGRC